MYETELHIIAHPKDTTVLGIVWGMFCGSLERRAVNVDPESPFCFLY